ncbi:Hypothetical protein, conserved [Brucella ceti str. Cudo]|uniref:Uncharacterized protein n=2 Tax=Brucella TaxID=234 RepID=C0GBJ3_9HYPH|nr:Hypothetical protein BSUIS_B0652 [Brucella suis ATCC 23445]EEH12694.1 Hypothetical protein, conserved [Brucella ceti str. Cudo]EFM55856.1 Hypothetical protein BIBO1_2396 [Brucella inopinata BO1]
MSREKLDPSAPLIDWRRIGKRHFCETSFKAFLLVTPSITIFPGV